MDIKYDIVIATKNRLKTLEISLPLMLQQSVRPEQVIVVDASQDLCTMAAVEILCKRLSQKHRCPISYQRSAVANLCLQRNQGLEKVLSEVVMLPDDDSFWYPEMAEKVMDVYRQDTQHLIGGVSARAVNRSPLQAANSAFKNRRKPRIPIKLARIKVRIGSYRKRFEKRFVPQPLFKYANDVYKSRAKPAVFTQKMIAMTPSLSGYAMSYRTKAIVEAGFDEILGYKVGYAFHEDRLASLSVLNNGYFLAISRRALVYHCASSARRAGGFEYGFTNIANYIYSCASQIPDSKEHRKTLLHFLRYKLFLFFIRRGTTYYKDVYRGAKTAFENGLGLLDSNNQEDLLEKYKLLCDTYLH